MSADNSILIKNIYYMLAYAYKALQQDSNKEFGAENFSNIHNLFAAIIARGVEHQLKQGLNKDYRQTCHVKQVLRGKIDMPGTIRLLAGQQHSLSCVYGVLTEDNLLNRILKAALVLLLHNGDVTLENKNALKKLLLFLVNVTEIKSSEISWAQLSYHRGNASYQMLIYICRLLFKGMLINKNGKVMLAKFMDTQDLCNLYEKFVLAYYQKHYPQLNPAAPFVDWILDDGNDAFLPKMHTDITLESAENILIIDTKYYGRILSSRYDKKSICSSNLYQIFSYVKNKAMQTNKTVSGMLLYAKTDEDVTPDETYSLSGNKFYVRTLDLNCEFEVIKRQLNNIVCENFG